MNEEKTFIFDVIYRGIWRERVVMEAKNKEEAKQKIKNFEDCVDVLDEEIISYDEIVNIE